MENIRRTTEKSDSWDQCYKADFALTHINSANDCKILKNFDKLDTSIFGYILPTQEIAQKPNEAEETVAVSFCLHKLIRFLFGQKVCYSK